MAGAKPQKQSVVTHGVQIIARGKHTKAGAVIIFFERLSCPLHSSPLLPYLPLVLWMTFTTDTSSQEKLNRSGPLAKKSIRMKREVPTMSLSALSSALSLSSDANSGHCKVAGDSSHFRGEIFVSFDDASSISSDGSKSLRHDMDDEHHLRGLLGDGGDTTDTGSSSGFPSLALSNSSLSSRMARARESLAVSSASDDHQDAIAASRDTQVLTGDTRHVFLPPTLPTRSVSQPQIVLENVEYVCSLKNASSFNDLSTMDEPITKEVAKDVFCKRIVPLEIPVNEGPSDVSTIYGGKHNNAVEYEEEDDPVPDVEQGVHATTTSSQAVEVALPVWRRYLGARSALELFFICLIAVSSTALVVLVIAVLVPK